MNAPVAEIVIKALGLLDINTNQVDITTTNAFTLSSDDALSTIGSTDSHIKNYLRYSHH